MAATFTINGENITVRHEFTHKTEIVMKVYNAIAEAHYQDDILDGEGQPVPFAMLTNNQKIQIVHKVDKKMLIEEYHKCNRQLTRAALEAENSDVSLGDS